MITKWTAEDFTVSNIQSQDCDRDGGSARAMVAVQFQPSGVVMLLCGHHYDLHADKIDRTRAVIFDTRKVAADV
jgi:hypothetical protein